MNPANAIIRELVEVLYLEIKENNLCTFSATLNAIQEAEEYLATGGWKNIPKDFDSAHEILLWNGKEMYVGHYPSFTPHNKPTHFQYLPQPPKQELSK